MTQNEITDTTIASQWTEEEQPKSETKLSEYNPYLEEIKKMIERAKLMEGTKPFVGFPSRIRKQRRAKNYRSRASRRTNRFLSKGKHL